jgi:hypothetical protein
MIVDKEKEIKLNTFAGLAPYKETDIQIGNNFPCDRVSVSIGIDNNVLRINIGNLIVEDICLLNCEICEKCRNTKYVRCPYYSFHVSKDFKIWHLKAIRKDDFFNLRNAFKLRVDGSGNHFIEINSRDFITLLKEKFSIETPFYLDKLRFVSWGKYDGNQNYVLSIKFYESIEENKNDHRPTVMKELIKIQNELKSQNELKAQIKALDKSLKQKVKEFLFGINSEKK